MKHIKAAYIEQLIEFDSANERELYFYKLDHDKKQYTILQLRGTSVRIRLQYNNNSMNMEEGE